MAEAMIELDKDNLTPQWVLELENRLQSRKQKLGHEIGAGAKCFTCKEKCPGLELHYWRKKCKNCKCTKELHDVAEDDDLRFQILFKDGKNSTKYLAAKSVLEVKVKDKVHKNVVLRQFVENLEVVKPMKFDWVPAEVSPILAADYMNELPSHKIPISGSVGAKYRKIQMKKQIPMHDIMPDQKENFTQEEQAEFHKYLENLRETAGIGKILRVKQTQFFEQSKPIYDVQSAQSTGTIKPISSEMNELNSTFRNINIQPSSRADNCNLTAIRPMATYVEASPRSALRSLPRTIPGSILRLPSAFKAARNSFENQSADNSNMNDQSLNNNTGIFDDTEIFNNTSAVLADDEESEDSINITGIHPLALSPTDMAAKKNDCDIENGRSSQAHDTPCASTPLEKLTLQDIIVTPSKTAELRSYLSSTPPSSEFHTAREDSNIVASDMANANNQTDTPTAIHNTDTEVHLVENKMKCVDCLGIIEFNSVAIFNEKAGPNAAWHPKCFVCKECKELLVDLVNFYHKGYVYCARHYTEKLKIHRCFACDELIFVKEYTLAEGQYYHLHHFCCVECDSALGGKQYVLNDFNENHPTCLDCFETIYAKKCRTCGEPIKAGQQGICFNDLNWHATPGCFKCTFNNCGKSLVNEKFTVKNLQPFCSSKCYELTKN